MPYGITLTLTIPPALRLPPNLGVTLHGAVFCWLQIAGLAGAYHDDAGARPKPFTVSPLERGGQGGRFRLTLLDDRLFEPVRNAINQRPFMEAPGHGGMARLSLANDPLVEQCTYAALAQAARTHRAITLRFSSPTSFHTDGMDFPLPDAEHVFGSHRRAWNAYAPDMLAIPDAWIEWLRQSVAIARFDLHSEEFHLPGHHHVGCVGEVRYIVPANAAAEPLDLARLNVLAEFAGYCGTGRRTTHGMGQTRRLQAAER